MERCKIALVDDHVLIRKGLAALIDKFHGYEVIFQADNGEDLLQNLHPENLPDVILLDVKMPRKDGFETMVELHARFSQIRVLVLSMFDNEPTIIRMIANGARGYVLKDVQPLELKYALDAVCQKGYYYSERVTGLLFHSINHPGKRDVSGIDVRLNEKEISFLKYASTELSYREIADKMCLSPRTIDGYRDNLFIKLQVRTRVGLVIFAIKNNIIDIMPDKP